MPLVLVPDAQIVISHVSQGQLCHAIGPGVSGSGAWPAANRAIYVPVRVSRLMTVAQLAVYNGSTVSGNIDLGLYDAAGTRLVSSGSTAQSGTSVLQVLNITDTQIDVGVYYLAIAIDNTTATLLRFAPGAEILRGLGFAQQASAFPLPSTATFAAVASAYFPILSMTSRTVL